MSSFVDRVRPSNRMTAILFDLFCVIGGSFFLALLSQPVIQLWFTPVPMTLQSLGVMLIGALLGSKRGAGAILLYLFEGGVGFPVFAGGGFGLITLLGPKGGYLFAFVVAAYLIGFLLERGWQGNYRLTLLALVIGTGVILTFGALWLSLYIGITQAFIMGIYPFLLGNCLQIGLAAFLIPSGWKWLQSFE